MTLFVCDASDRLWDFAERPGAWIEATPSALTPADATLWKSVGGGERLWIRTAGVPASIRFWSRIFVVASAPSSQFDALRDGAASTLEPPGPVACLAITGRGFHGHRGRSWAALAGNLHLSVALPRPDVPARHGLALTILPAVALCDAVLASGGGAIRPGIKWVNDLLVEGRKVAGVISTTQSQGDRLELAVLGIGLNVERTPQVAPTPFTPEVGALRQFAGGETLTLSRLFWAMLDALPRRIEQLAAHGPAPLLDAYRRASLALGRRVRVWEEGIDEVAPPGFWPPPLARGIVREIGEDLALRIEGRQEPVARGRLAFEEACAMFLARSSDEGSFDRPT